jgi:hypothetical protein
MDGDNDMVKTFGENVRKFSFALVGIWMLLSFFGCAPTRHFQRNKEIRNIDMKLISEQIVATVQEQDGQKFLSMISEALRAKPDTERAIDDLFFIFEDGLMEVTIDFFQKGGGGEWSKGKYCESGGVYINVLTKESQYIMSVNYTYYSEVSEKNIGIDDIMVVRMHPSDSEAFEPDVVFMYPEA